MELSIRVKYLILKEKKHNIDSLILDIKAISNALKNKDKLKKIQEFLEGNTSIVYMNKMKKINHRVSLKNEIRETDKLLLRVKSIEQGVLEESMMIVSSDAPCYTIHPTQKPVRLLERLLALVIPKDKHRNEVVVADFFAGSMSCMEAVHNMGMRGIATEIDQEYFEKGKQRIMQLQPKLF